MTSNFTCPCSGTTHDADCWTLAPAKGIDRKMTREELEAALAYLVNEFGPSPEWPEGDPEWVEYQPLAAAARKQLALMPDECGNCYPMGEWGDGIEHDHDGTPLGVCSTCHGSGKVYPQETVVMIEGAIMEAGADFIVEGTGIAVLEFIGRLGEK